MEKKDVFPSALLGNEIFLRDRQGNLPAETASIRPDAFGSKYNSADQTRRAFTAPGNRKCADREAPAWVKFSKRIKNPVAPPQCVGLDLDGLRDTMNGSWLTIQAQQSLAQEKELSPPCAFIEDGRTSPRSPPENGPPHWPDLSHTSSPPPYSFPVIRKEGVSLKLRLCGDKSPFPNGSYLDNSWFCEQGRKQRWIYNRGPTVSVIVK
jgi:hypothetical protein